MQEVAAFVGPRADAGGGRLGDGAILGEARLAECRGVVREENPVRRIGVFGVGGLDGVAPVVEVQGTQLAFFRRPHDDGFEVEVAVGDVDGDDPTWAQVLTVRGESLEREQVHGDGVAAEGVEDDHVVVLRWQFLERQAGVAHAKLDFCWALTQVMEGALGQTDDVIVNLVEVKLVPLAPPSGERAGAEADGRDLASVDWAGRGEDAADPAP